MPRPVTALLLAVALAALGCGTGSPPSSAASGSASGAAIGVPPSGAPGVVPASGAPDASASSGPASSLRSAGSPGAAASSPSSSGAAASSPSSSGAAASSPPGPTSVPGGGLDTDVPPVATLTIVDGDGTAWEGALGTYTWRGVGSDSPWFVPASGATVPAGATLGIRFGDSDVVPIGWGVSWATVDGSLAGSVVGGSRGTPGAPPRAPDEPGTYAFQVDADFGADRRAAWYWRVDVVP